MAYYTTILTYYPDTFQNINTWGRVGDRRHSQKVIPNFLQKVKCNSLLHSGILNIKKQRLLILLYKNPKPQTRQVNVPIRHRCPASSYRKQGQNSRTEKSGGPRYQITLGLPFMVPDLVFKFQVIC